MKIKNLDIFILYCTIQSEKRQAAKSSLWMGLTTSLWMGLLTRPFEKRIGSKWIRSNLDSISCKRGLGLRSQKSLIQKRKYHRTKFFEISMTKKPDLDTKPFQILLGEFGPFSCEHASYAFLFQILPASLEHLNLRLQ